MRYFLHRLWAVLLLACIALPHAVAQSITKQPDKAASTTLTATEGLSGEPKGTIGNTGTVGGTVTVNLSNLPQLTVCNSKRGTGQRMYELNDHLNNVRAVVSD